jgi:hypothetical protein
MRSRQFPGSTRCVLISAVVCLFSLSSPAANDPASGKNPNFRQPGLYLKVQMDQRLKLSKLKPGDVVGGSLGRDVYSADKELFPKGSHVSMVVDHTEKRRRIPNDHWPWVVNAFTPRQQSYPVFTTATISGPAGSSSLQVTLLSVSRKREVQAQAKKVKKSDQATTQIGPVETSKSGGVYGSGKLTTPIMVLEGFSEGEGKTASHGAASESTPAELSGIETLPVGTACKILLLGSVSASKNRAGDAVEARLLEPVFADSRVAIPAGSLIEGKVVKRIPPRWGSRAGSLYLTFTKLTLPDGNLVPISASLTGAELDQRSHTRIDSEGQLHGEHPGKAWMAINIGVTAGLAKEADDTTQLIIEAIVSTATDASTAGTARIVSSCVSGIFMVSRHGRDVVLPRFTEMNIAFDRPVSVTGTEATAMAETPGK